MQSAAVSTQDVATGLGVPWGVTFLPDGTALIAERDTGAVKHLTAPGQLREIGNVTGVVPRGEAG
ncbi:MAG: PQQ-dependent sugar dehydrogenase, partial [Mycobacterium sp.]